MPTHVYQKKKKLFLRIAFGHFTLKLFFVFVFTSKKKMLSVDPSSMLYNFRRRIISFKVNFFPRTEVFYETIYYNLKYKEKQIVWICLGVFWKLFNEQFIRFVVLSLMSLLKILNLIFVLNIKYHIALFKLY